MKPGKNFIGVGVGAVILNDVGEILLLLRKKEPEKGTWSIPGGKVEFFEELEETIMREVGEELGVSIKLIKLLGVTDHILKSEGSHWVAPTYLAQIVSGSPKNMEPDKHADFKWFSLDKLPENLSLIAVKAVDYLRIDRPN